MDIPQQARRLAEEQGHGHVDGGIGEVGVAQEQIFLRRRLAHHGVGAALALAEALELLQPLGVAGMRALTYDLVLTAALWFLIAALAMANGRQRSRRPLRTRVA